MKRTLRGRSAVTGDSLAEAIRSTARQLSAVPTSASEQFDALAFVLSRVADADRHITAEESRRMESALEEHAGLNPAQAALVVEVAKHRKRMADAARAYRESRQLRRCLRTDQRSRLIDALYDVAAADGELADCEVAEILQLAAELGMSRDEVAGWRCGNAEGP